MMYSQNDGRVLVCLQKSSSGGVEKKSADPQKYVTCARRHSQRAVCVLDVCEAVIYRTGVSKVDVVQ
jgi:hypothetical protein